MWRSGYTFFVKWHRYLGARLERNLQNGAVIRMPGFTHSLKKNSFCLKIENQYFFYYDIYGFAIIKIYT